MIATAAVGAEQNVQARRAAADGGVPRHVCFSGRGAQQVCAALSRSRMAPARSDVFCGLASF